MSPWLPYLYQYGITGLFVILVVIFCFRTGALSLKRPEDRWTLTVVVLGYVFYLLLHGLWIWAAGGAS